MTAQTIATARIRIRPYLEDGAKQRIEADVDRATAAGGKVRISADTDDARARLDVLRLRLDEMGRKVATAKVDLDGDVKAQDRLSRLEFQLRRVGLTTARPKVSLEGVERANLQLDALEAKLAAAGRGGAGGGGRGTAGGAGGGFLDRVTRRGFFNPGAIGTLAAFAAPAAVPIAGVGLGVGAGAFAAGGALLPGLVGFGAASRSSIQQVQKNVEQLNKIEQRLKNTPQTVTRTTSAASAAQIQAAEQRLAAAQARLASAQARGNVASSASAEAAVTSAQARLTALQQRGGTTTKPNAEYTRLLEKQRDILKSMDPAQRRAAQNVEKLDDTWKRFQKDLQPQSFRLLADGASIADKGLKLLLPSSQAVGNELDILARSANKALGDPFWRQFFHDFLPGEGARAADAFGTAIGKIVTAGAHLVQDFAPLSHDFEGGLVRLSTRFESWTEGQGPGRFVAFVEREGPQVAKTLHALADGVAGVGKGLAPIGQVELAALTPVLHFIGELGDQHPEVITALGAAYLSVAVGLKGIAAVKGIGEVIAAARGISGLRGSGGGLSGGGVVGRGTPVPVYVTNWQGGPHGGPVAAGKTVTTAAEEDAAGRAGKGIVTRIAERVGLGGAVRAAAPFAPLIAPGVDVLTLTSGDSAPRKPLAQRNNVYSQLFNVLDPKGRRDFPASTYSGGKLDATAATTYLARTGTPDQLRMLQELAKTYPQIASALKGVHEAAERAGDSLDTAKSSVAHLRAEFATFGPQVTRALNGLVNLPGYLQTAENAARNGGFAIGKNLTDGITIGIAQGQDKVVLESVKVVQGALHASRTTAQLGSPSKITTQYGRWMAEGLAVGFTGFSSDLLKAFSQTTQTALDKLGLQMNSAADRLRTDLQSRAQLRSTVQSSLLSSADVGQVTLSNVGGGSIAGNNSYLIGQLRTLDKDEALLRRRHLNSTYLQQIAQAGPERGVQIAQDILSGREGSIGGLNRQASTLSRYAGNIGTTVAGATYAGAVSRDEQMLARAVAALERTLTKRLDLSTASEHAMERAFEQALRRAFPTLNVSTVDHALGVQVRAAL